MKLFCQLFIFLLLINVSLFVPQSYAVNLAQNICEYIAVDDKGRLRKLLKSNRLKLRTVFKDVSCDNNNILVFAAKNNAIEIGELLIKKLPRSVVEKEIENLSGLSAPLTEVAIARTRG